MALKLPKWVRLLVFVPHDEVKYTEARLREAEASGADIHWSVHGSSYPRATAAGHESRIADESEGDVLAIAFTGLSDKLGPAAWSVLASASRSRLEKLISKYPHCDLVSMVKGIILGYLIKVLEEDEPRPDIVIVVSEDCGGK
jgi:hypothetical protein